MNTDDSLINQIVAAAQARGLTQKALAERSGISEETLSRMKKRGSGNFSLIVKLAQVAGAPLSLANTPTPAVSNQKAASFRSRYAVPLAWSNKKASDDVLIRRALVKPGFQLLLDAAIEFGVDRLSTTWQYLKTDAADEVVQAAPVTERILQHIEDGYRQASR